jgi:hypothetical protein
VAIGLGVLAALGVAVLARGPGPEAPAASPTEAIITFESVPRGASVRENDVLLGVTPFIRQFPISDGTRRFKFELAGHAPAVLQATFEKERQTVRVTLEPQD